MLLETICFEEGNYPLLRWHQDRVNKAFEKHFLTTKKPHNLASILPKLKENQKLKVRFLYSETDYKLEIHEYKHRAIEKVQCVYDNEISYPHKFQDRLELQKLYDLRGDTDEILIIKGGLVTDAFYYNAVFWDSQCWVTPKSYLLPGTRRQYLLDQEKIKAMSIGVNDIANFEKLSLVNALVDLEECVVLTKNIRLK
ncbi:MAG: aminotransferase class IV [Cyclobacteriaceae bacterium]